MEEQVNGAPKASEEPPSATADGAQPEQPSPLQMLALQLSLEGRAAQAAADTLDPQYRERAFDLFLRHRMDVHTAVAVMRQQQDIFGAPQSPIVRGAPGVTRFH